MSEDIAGIQKQNQVNQVQDPKKQAPNPQPVDLSKGTFNVKF